MSDDVCCPASGSPPACLHLAIGLFIILLSSRTSPALAGWEEFKSAPIESSKSQTIRGLVSRPDGIGPFPAVIIAHGCFGIESNQQDWARRLNDWGYVTLVVDSFKPRAVETVCSDPEAVSPKTRACDLLGAAAFLRNQNYVIPEKIGLIGFSHGGWAALYAAQEKFAEKAQQAPLQAVVAYYPWCPRFGMNEPHAPLLLLIGKADDWTPVARCRALRGKDFERQLELIAFDNAYHGFDDSSVTSPREFEGHTMSFDSAAAAASIDRTRAFFSVALSP